MKKNANKLNKMLARGKDISGIFKHFTMNEWIFSTNNLQTIEKAMSREEREIFYLDVMEINWETFLSHFAWRLKKFILKEEADTPANVKRLDLLSRRNDLDNFFVDINWAYSHGRQFQPSNSKTMIKKVLSSKKVKKIIDKDLYG